MQNLQRYHLDLVVFVVEADCAHFQLQLLRKMTLICILLNSLVFDVNYVLFFLIKNKEGAVFY
jgi:hypothetical protein